MLNRFNCLAIGWVLSCSLVGGQASATLLLTAEVFDTPGLDGFKTYTVTATSDFGLVSGFGFSAHEQGIFGPLNGIGVLDTQPGGFAFSTDGLSAVSPLATQFLPLNSDWLTLGVAQSETSLQQASSFLGREWDKLSQHLPFAQIVTNDPSAVSLNGQFGIRPPGSELDFLMERVDMSLADISIGPAPDLEIRPRPKPPEPAIPEPPVVPPVIIPPVIEPPVVETPPVIVPPVVVPPVGEPPVVEPPIVEPPVVVPPLIEPPVVEIPVVDPPIAELPLVGLNFTGTLTSLRARLTGLIPAVNNPSTTGQVPLQIPLGSAAVIQLGFPLVPTWNQGGIIDIALPDAGVRLHPDLITPLIGAVPIGFDLDDLFLTEVIGSRFGAFDIAAFSTVSVNGLAQDGQRAGVPEPCSMVLLISGAFLFAMKRRR